MVFFRADDVGVPGAQFTRLMHTFTSRQVPIDLAVVPAWLTRTRWQALQPPAGADPLLCWHQHGWRHANHEVQGKKQEFGPHRSAAALRRDILLGRQRLEEILGAGFTPVFTPPWNRCSHTALESLREFGYHAVSRSQGAAPPPLPGLPDYPVNVDLHTRREPDPLVDWPNLLLELIRGIAGGACGVMLHHQRMNDNAFGFLEALLDLFKGQKGIHLVNFKDRIDG